MRRRLPTRKRSDDLNGPGKALCGWTCPFCKKLASSRADQMVEGEFETAGLRPTRGAMRYCRFGLLVY